ncbi:MAG TPA: adenylate/guanylate cyclase domain-containing protein [Candidatus Limnocylindria bacterium]|nr:adenylate/guanylate cyclase domain-containing protein [Candidatus Limnocylindria bacterium]
MSQPCPRCASPAPAGARFCPACGSRIGAGEPARFASPGAYTPPHLARRILDSREALEGERKQVTVLFAGIHGIIEAVGERDPEEIGPVIDRVRELMMEAVHRYEGTVNQVVGDGIMALFGAPLANEDHAVRACYAALRMQTQMTALGDALQRSLGLPLQIRVGLNSGEVVARSIGSDLSFTYTAVGQTVHLAARMEQMAKPASILATEHTVALVRGRVATRALGPVPVRGLPAPVEVHEISGAVPIRSRLDAASPRARSPLVGREALLARFDEAIDAMLAGTGQVVSLVGEAGVGKSRLCLEFARRCRARGCLVIEAPAVSYGRAAGYRPGVELHRRYFQVEIGDDAATIRDKVAARLRVLDPELEEGVSDILWVLGASRDGVVGDADPDRRRRQVMRSVHRLVTRQGRRQPFVMILEDMQWVDSETHAAMDALVEALPPRTLVASTYRPEYVDRWSRHPGYTQVRVEALEPSAAGAMLDALLGDDPGLVPLKRLVAERANGNPLFLEECVTTLVETGALAGERGAYRLTRPVLSLEVPATVQATIASRIDRLRYEDKRLLQAASVIGDAVPVRLLETVADASADEVRRGLDQLHRAGLLDQRALFPDLEYGFRHALVHDVAYESLLHERRRALHARILDAIEGAYEGGRLVEQTERLAHHAFLGEVWDRAVDYCRRAGARTLARMASWESVSFFERALAALARRPADPAARATGVDLRCDLHNALVPLGQLARSVAVLREAAALAEALGDRPRLARALSFESNVHWELGEADEAARVGEHALAIAEETRDLGLQVVGNYNVGAGRRALGDYRQALTVLRRNLALLPLRGTGETFGLPGIAAVLTRAHLAWSLAELGQFDEAVAVAQDGVQLAEGCRDPYSLAYALLGLGGTLVRRGRMWEADGVLERGIALGAEMPAFFPPFAGDLAIVYAMTSRGAEALALAERAVRQAQSMQRLGRLSLITTHLGEVRLLTGQPGAAEAEGRRALALAQAHKERGNMVYALRLLGLAAAERQPPDLERARGHHAEALALADELGMRPLAARCHLGLGRLARRAGDGAGADKHLGEARALFEDMGMTFWLERLHGDSSTAPGPGGRAGGVSF